MIKICYYELKRILSNSLFWISMLIGMIYAFQIFITDIVRGISYTAPFSGWSYGFFLSKISIFICIIGFFMVSKNYSKREKEKTKLIYAENKQTKNYLNYKTYVSLITAFLMFSCIVIFSFILYASIFHYFEFGKFIAIIFFTMIPPLLFTMGLSTFFFTINAWIANIFMLLLLSIEFLILKNGLSIFGSFFFKDTPLLSLTTPEFFLTSSFVLSRIIMIGIGLLAFWLAPIMAAKKHTICNVTALKNK